MILGRMLRCGDLTERSIVRRLLWMQTSQSSRHKSEAYDDSGKSLKCRPIVRPLIVYNLINVLCHSGITISNNVLCVDDIQ